MPYSRKSGIRYGGSFQETFGIMKKTFFDYKTSSEIKALTRKEQAVYFSKLEAHEHPERAEKKRKEKAAKKELEKRLYARVNSEGTKHGDILIRTFNEGENGGPDTFMYRNFTEFLQVVSSHSHVTAGPNLATRQTLNFDVDHEKIKIENIESWWHKNFRGKPLPNVIIHNSAKDSVQILYYLDKPLEAGSDGQKSMHDLVRYWADFLDPNNAGWLNRNGLYKDPKKKITNIYPMGKIDTKLYEWDELKEAFGWTEERRLERKEAVTGKKQKKIKIKKEENVPAKEYPVRHVKKENTVISSLQGKGEVKNWMDYKYTRSGSRNLDMFYIGKDFLAKHRDMPRVDFVTLMKTEIRNYVGGTYQGKGLSPLNETIATANSIYNYLENNTLYDGRYTDTDRVNALDARRQISDGIFDRIVEAMPDLLEKRMSKKEFYTSLGISGATFYKYFPLALKVHNEMKGFDYKKAYADYIFKDALATKNAMEKKAMAGNALRSREHMAAGAFTLNQYICKETDIFKGIGSALAAEALNDAVLPDIPDKTGKNYRTVDTKQLNMLKLQADIAFRQHRQAHFEELTGRIKMLEALR